MTSRKVARELAKAHELYREASLFSPPRTLCQYCGLPAAYHDQFEFCKVDVRTKGKED